MKHSSAQTPVGSIVKLAAPALIILAWEFVVPLLYERSFLLPLPSEILKYMIKMFQEGTITEHFSATLTRLATGIAVGGGIGAAIGVVMGMWRQANLTLDGLVAIIMPIPKIAIFPLFLIVFGYGESARIVLIGLSAFFPMLIAGRTAVQTIDPDLVEVCANYEIKGMLWLRKFLLPACMPVLLSGFRVAVTTAFVVTIAIEMLASEAGLGLLLWLGWETMRMEEIYGLLFLIGLFGLLVNAAITRWENIYQRKNHET